MTTPTRVRFTDIATDTGTTDTGLNRVTKVSSPCWGWLQSVRWYPDALDDTGQGDTGALMKLYQDFNPNDTGDSFLIASYDNQIGVAMHRYPRVPVHDVDGAEHTFGPSDTGHSYADTGNQLTTPVLFTGEQLRVEVTAEYADNSGTLYAQFSENK